MGNKPLKLLGHAKLRAELNLSHALGRRETPMSQNVLDAIRSVNFNWAVMLRDVWREPDGDVSEIHLALRTEFASQLDAMAATDSPASPSGWVITGTGGSGKTHLLGRFRAECTRRNICFVLVDMTDVRDFWDTVLLGYFSSLQEIVAPQRTQFRMLIDGLFGQVKYKDPPQAVIAKLAALPADKFRPALDSFLAALNRKFPAQVGLNGDVIRAVMAINSADFGLISIGNAWLQGEEIEPEARRLLGSTRSRDKSSSIVRGLSWLMSLGGASVVALDQLDPIVTQLDLEYQAVQATSAQAIINKLGAGMSELRDLTQRTLVVVSCVDNTWKKLEKNTPKQFTDRYLRPKVLPPVSSLAAVEALLAERMKQALRGTGISPAYPTWPFKKEWFKDVVLDSPREILKKCQSHLGECVRRGEVKELPPGWEKDSVPPPPDLGKIDDRLAALDARFEAARSAAKVEPILDEEQEDTIFGPLVRSALRCAIAESRVPDHVDVALDESFTGGATMKPLHARLRLIFPKENSREEHFCVRVLNKTHARSFAARLRPAITSAGIDKDLKFRRLAIIRRPSYPAGATTKKLIEQFEQFGGKHLIPADDDLKTLEALRVMEAQSPAGWSDWLAARRHACKTPLIREAIPGFFDIVSPSPGADTAAGATSEKSTKSPGEKAPSSLFPANGKDVSATKSAGDDSSPTPSGVWNDQNSPKRGATNPPGQGKPETPPVIAPPVSAGQILLGHRLMGELLSTQQTTIPLSALRKHGAVFAGAGSGKTVLLKRLIEEAALAGVPAVVIDCANDLAAIGDPWPSPPPQWNNGDADLARRFFETTQRIIWTPGRDSGNALGLAPLPDLTAFAAAPEELREAITMSVDALSPVIATGAKPMIAKKQAILHKVFQFLAENGNSNLTGLSAVLRDLPDQATAGIADEKKLARTMADDLSAQLTINPLLTSSGPVLDPAVLFGGRAGKTRVSIISLIGLPTLNGQQQFLNQLAMTLFTWIKKNPPPPEMPLRGILVIDEARDFVPSRTTSACLGSMQRLAAQARKYGLGVILATQNPKDLDNKIVGQCSTQWFGKMNAPAAMDAARELLHERGASSGENVGALKTGRFYVSNADHLSPPARLATPMCLSAHTGPLDQELVLEKARACRLSMGSA